MVVVVARGGDLFWWGNYCDGYGVVHYYFFCFSNSCSQFSWRSQNAGLKIWYWY